MSKASDMDSGWTAQILQYEGDWDNQKHGNAGGPTGDVIQVTKQQTHQDTLGHRVY
jgi:hypothetical protein